MRTLPERITAWAVFSLVFSAVPLAAKAAAFFGAGVELSAEVLAGDGELLFIGIALALRACSSLFHGMSTRATARGAPPGIGTRPCSGCSSTRRSTSTNSIHELARLDTDDVDLEGGLITIPSSRIAEGRTLYLEGRQVLALHVYLAEARPALLTATGKETEQLFTSAGSGARLNNAVAVLLRELRARHPFFRDAKQLRASRLALWLKTEHLREVQHMAGHRYVSSTERYQAQDLDRLQASLAKHHPLS